MTRREARIRLGSRSLRRKNTKHVAMGHPKKVGAKHPWKARRPRHGHLLKPRVSVRVARLLKGD